MTPLQFSANMERIRKALVANIRAAEERSLREASRAFVKRSSGTASTSQLRKLGHPFAARAPQSSPDPSVVNDQGGPFRESWVQGGPTINGAGTMQSSVINVDPKSVYMFGTKTMVKRGIDDAVAADIEPRRLQYHSDAVDAALKA